MENDDPFRVWNGIRKDDPFAPHNGFDADDPFKPWNSPFGKEDDLTDSERRAYGLSPKYNSYDNNENDY
jgi:hypothetical protein